MSANQSRKKPAGKARKKPRMWSPPEEADEAIQSILAQKINATEFFLGSFRESNSVFSSRSPFDSAYVPPTIKGFLAAFELLANRLERIFAIKPSALDEKRLVGIEVVMTACRDMLTKKAMMRGCPMAIKILSAQTCLGCESLRKLSNGETFPKAAKAVKVVAAESEFWPVMLSPKKNSREAAREYLRAIGVGTKSIPPTSNDTRIIAANPWTKIASDLIKRIREYVMYLTERSNKDSWLYRENPNDIFENWSPPKLLEAEKWRQQVLGLPRSLNKRTCSKWWVEAKEMLKDYLKTNPLEAEALFKLVKTTARDEAKVPTTIVIKSVREAFYAIVTSSSLAND